MPPPEQSDIGGFTGEEAFGVTDQRSLLPAGVFAQSMD